MTFVIEEVLPVLADEVKTYQVPVVDLIAVQTKDPYKILVATILSARTKDEVTAKAAERLFKQVPDLESLAAVSEEELRKLIYPVGFFKNKASYLAKLPGALMAKFGGIIPDEVDKLTELPGVGRKTANLVVAVAFGKPAICVDTHVHRIMNIWGYVQTKTPLETEMALRKKLPEQYWLTVNSILVAFGQGTCKSVRPHCDRCLIANQCRKLGVTPRNLPGSATKKGADKTIKMVSWNVNGLRALEKKGFVEVVAELDADIIALQEIKAQPEQLSDQLKNIPGYRAYWFAAEKKGYSGVGVYSREEPLAVIYGIDHKEHDYEGRVLTLEYGDFYLVNVYFPNARHELLRLDYKLAFNRDLHNFLDTLALKKSVVVCGDFNVAHKEIDLTNPKQNEKNPGFAPEERAWMDEFIAAGYIDTFRLFNQQPGQYTWWSYRFNARARNIGWRIDYFCVDAKSEKRVAGAEILADIAGSDHCPVVLTFR
ncbi:MAG: exodeoxyribonuclease III [Desulfobulbaceae bacterium]|nr:exodeoxyribonuclease III [Desulfobulbaceae bacterium]HIJ78993.1 exodeoxyribonuclease III [Deltaproteobacteria bacterium]